MPNTVTKFPATSPSIIQTTVPQTGSDVTGFVFNAWTYRALLVADTASTCNIYFAGASSGNSGFTIPTAGQPPLILEDTSIGGAAVTFNGTNAKNVMIIEFLNRIS